MYQYNLKCESLACKIATRCRVWKGRLVKISSVFVSKERSLRWQRDPGGVGAVSNC